MIIIISIKVVVAEAAAVVNIQPNYFSFLQGHG
jgi:hypothetical protein